MVLLVFGFFKCFWVTCILDDPFGSRCFKDFFC